MIAITKSIATALILPLAAIMIAMAQTSGGSNPTDKYLWLEDVWGGRSMSWVKAENARTAKILEADPRFAELEKTALTILEAPDRLALPDINHQDVLNTWKDNAHPLGLLRRTSLSDYLSPTPQWQTLLDYDALANKENQRWVPKERVCLQPENELCLIALSAGGEDAVTYREFNVNTAQFVENGFVLPKSKQTPAWQDKDTLLVSRDWGPGTMTKSGYPFVVKQWKRGEPLDAAQEIYRGSASDELPTAVAVSYDGDGNQAILIDRGVTFFEHEFALLSDGTVHRLALPRKVQISDDFLVRGQFILTLNEDWTPSGQSSTFAQGSVVALNLQALKTDPQRPKPTLVFAPTGREFPQATSATKDHLLLTTLENVQGRAYLCDPGANGGAWTRKRLNLPDNLSVRIESANSSSNRFFLQVEGFLTPNALWLGDSASGDLKEAKSTPPKFDASGITVEQLQATSKDGTQIP
ncbi:MAG: S9 family peptidase, partial [Acidobacteriaceae bacterium]|nr:S9 family peptidase [Acidobacteriaceae bacterium]